MKALATAAPRPPPSPEQTFPGELFVSNSAKKIIKYLILGKISSQLVTTFNKWKLFYSWKCSPELWSPHVDECSTEAEISLNLLLNKIQSNITFCKGNVHLGLSLIAWQKSNIVIGQFIVSYNPKHYQTSNCQTDSNILESQFVLNRENKSFFLFATSNFVINEFG